MVQLSLELTHLFLLKVSVGVGPLEAGESCQSKEYLILPVIAQFAMLIAPRGGCGGGVGGRMGRRNNISKHALIVSHSVGVY